MGGLAAQLASPEDSYGILVAKIRVK